MKSILVAAAIAAMITAPALAQSYTAGQGSGNVIDTPLAEKTNGAYGYGGTVAPRAGDSQAAYQVQGGATSAFAYAPEGARKGPRGRTWRSDQAPER